MGDNDLPVTKLSQQTNRNMILNIVPEKKKSWEDITQNL